MDQYLDLMRRALRHGDRRMDRTGTGTLAVFGHQMRFDLTNGFPVLTTKKLHLRSIIIELLWFLRGDTNIAWLRRHKVGIWDEWATYKTHANRYLSSLASERSDEQLRLRLSDALPIKAKRERLSELLWFTKGRHYFDSISSDTWDEDNLDLGPVYGKQWRDWETVNGDHIDQIKNLVKDIKNDPTSRRQIVTAWNPGDLAAMALAPCHCLFQTYVANGRLSLQLYQRSADIFLGVPFNIASYALLTHMLAQQCGLEPGEFVWTGGDCHLYSNHLEQAEEQLRRTPGPLPRLEIVRRPDAIDGYAYEDFVLHDYVAQPHIKASVAV